MIYTTRKIKTLPSLKFGFDLHLKSHVVYESSGRNSACVGTLVDYNPADDRALKNRLAAGRSAQKRKLCNITIVGLACKL